MSLAGRLMMSTLAALVSIGLNTAQAAAQDLEDPLVNHYNPDISSHYRANSNSIVALRDAVLNEIDGEVRLQAFRHLVTRYPLAGLPMAVELVADGYAPLAVLATRFLASQATMSDHTMSGHTMSVGLDMPPSVTDMVRVHTIARQGLLTALDDERPDVWSEAAATLASLSDERALRKIVEGAKSGSYPANEAINYLALSRQEVGSPYIEDFLGPDEPGVEASAVAYLMDDQSYQSRMISEYLLNPEASATARTAAAQTLAVSDPEQFQYYATAILADPATSAPVYDATLESYLASQPEITTEQVGRWLGLIERYEQANPGTQLDRATGAIRALER